MATRYSRGMIVTKDGDSWCFMFESNENLQRDPAIFINEEDTNMDAIFDELVELENPPEEE